MLKAGFGPADFKRRDLNGSVLDRREEQVSQTDDVTSGDYDYEDDQEAGYRGRHFARERQQGSNSQSAEMSRQPAGPRKVVEHNVEIRIEDCECGDENQKPDREAYRDPDRSRTDKAEGLAFYLVNCRVVSALDASHHPAQAEGHQK